MPGPGGSDRRWLLVAVGIQLALATWILSSRHYWPRYDSGTYISAAVGVARGVGLRDVTSPVTRPGDSWTNVPGWVRRSPERMSTPDWPAFVQYPPLLPLALAPLVRLGQGRFVVLQLLPLAAGLATLLLVYRWRAVLFPGPWRLTLLLCAGSTLTLYATRVQSEAIHAVAVLVALRLLAQAHEDPARLPRWAGLAALALAVGCAVHVKLAFFALGVAAWLLLVPRAPLARRVWSSAAVTALAVVAPVLFNFQASWVGRPDLGQSGTQFSLWSNPYFWTDGWNPNGATLAQGGAARTLALRAEAAGSLVWSGITTGRSQNGALAPFAGLFVLALLAGTWWRHRGGLLALPTATYLAGVLFSPWAETRMIVPVLAPVIHALATAVARVPSLRRVGGPAGGRLALLAAGAAVMTLQAAHWLALTPELDVYALECIDYRPYLLLARVVRDVPPEKPVIASVDNSAFALVTGHPTFSLSSAEWKASDPRVYLKKGGALVALGPIVPAELVGGTQALTGELSALAGPRTRRDVRVGRVGLALEWVRIPPPDAPPTSAAPTLVPGRIHHRWLELSAADREPLARGALPPDQP